MPSTLNPTKLAYTILIKEHLNHILNNSRLMEKMYFGRGIETPEKSELWHEDIWQRSPLYGDATIFIDNGKTHSMTLFGKTLLICFQWNTLWENL